MRTISKLKKSNQFGSALMLTMIMSAIALTILAGIMTWSASSARLTHRSIQYTRSTAAAEGATEKVVSQIKQDFLYGGESLVVNNLNSYRLGTVPSTADSAYWNNWEFNDANGNVGQTFVQRTPGNNYVVLDSTFAGLKGYVSTYTVVSHARDNASVQDVTAGVLQELQLTGIPIFQFYLFSSGNMEISCGQPFVGIGRVHANGHLYVEPDNSLTFASAVTAVLDILFQRDPNDPRGLVPNGSVVYESSKTAPVSAMTLPIGVTNTPAAIREIIEPPAGEPTTSPIGKLRYYNQSDMVITVSDAGIFGNSGSFNGFSTQIPTNELALFVSTNSNFMDWREGKTVLPIDIDIGALTTWSQTNSNLRLSLVGSNLTCLYVDDRRSLPATSLGAVRVVNGRVLPQSGLTVATSRPLYVQGHYNQPDDIYLGTTNTSTTKPASLVADAITFLSESWSDSNSLNPVGSRIASNTTVNAALLTGVVETTTSHYSGGMENFPRFLETWGLGNTNTYNGSMIKMFPSLYATGAWNNNNNIYDPPARNWAYDVNFDDPTKLPPKTPQFQQVKRHQWATVAPSSNVAVTVP